MKNTGCDNCYYSKLCPVKDLNPFGCRNFIRLTDLIAESFRAFKRFCDDQMRCDQCDLINDCPISNAEIGPYDVLASALVSKFDPSMIERG